MWHASYISRKRTHVSSSCAPPPGYLNRRRHAVFDTAPAVRQRCIWVTESPRDCRTGTSAPSNQRRSKGPCVMGTDDVTIYLAAPAALESGGVATPSSTGARTVATRPWTCPAPLKQSPVATRSPPAPPRLRTYATRVRRGDGERATVSLSTQATPAWASRMAWETAVALAWWAGQVGGHGTHR